ncbi:MAG: hypothetical protein KGL39_56310 [Patescibacteria group bacterium]|nr:hypothetical protein [Patescibacteria group bacterium]
MSSGKVVVRLTSPVTSEKQYWRAGEKYECGESEAKKRIAVGDAVPYVDGEADYIPPDGTVANVIVNKTVREQTQTVQTRRQGRQTVSA